MLRKVLGVFLSISMILGCFSFAFKENWSVVFASDYDFPNNEGYYNELCVKAGLTTEEKNACRAFRDYNQSKLDDVYKRIEEIEASIEAISADIAKQESVLVELQGKISQVEAQIKTIEGNIKTVEASIEDLNQQIADREQRIYELNEQIKSHLRATQPLISTNQYIRFVMGANSFVDLIRRVNSFQKFISYDKQKMNELEEEKVKLELDKATLEEQKAELKRQQESLQSYKGTLSQMESQQKKVISNLRAAQAAQRQAREEAMTISSQLENLIDDIEARLDGFTPSPGWSLPVRGYFRVTSSFPLYEGTWGGFHNAIDIGGQAYGADIYASANGVVVNTYNGCGYNSGLYCGNMHGNYVQYIVIIGETAYLITSQHLSDVYVSIGDQVKGNRTVIGALGNTGYSFGAHLHQAIIRMGNMSIKEAVRSYNNTGSFFYGVSYSTAGVCSYRGYAPCYEDPQQIYGIYYPNSYRN